MTLQEWKAQQGHGRSAMTTPPAPVAATTPEDDLTPGPLGEMRHANSGDDYASAFEGELLRTGKEAVKGLLRSPWDAVKGLLGLPGQAAKGLVQDLPQLVADPSLLLEAPGALIEGASDLAKHPREAGSLLGQTLLAPKIPGAANTALAKGPTLAGRALSAAGRGAEAVGTSKLGKMATKYGPMEAVFRGDPYGAAVAAAPKVLEYGGKGLQKLGRALDGVDLSFQGRKPFSPAEDLGAAPAATPEADTVRETVRTAREAKAGGASRGQAAQRAGWPLGKSAEVPYQAEAAPPNTDLSALDAARTAKQDSAWANDKSGDPNWNNGEGDPMLAGSEPNRPARLSPIERFLANDPQARIGGEGRMTGQFEEGNGGLSDVAAGNIDQHTPPSALDELSQMSGRALSPEAIQALLEKYRNVQAGS